MLISQKRKLEEKLILVRKNSTEEKLVKLIKQNVGFYVEVFYPHKTDCPVKGKHCNRSDKESHVEQCFRTKFRPKCFKKQLNLVTTSSPSLEFDNHFHDDVLDVYVIGTLFTNEDNNDDIGHSNLRLESAEVNSISDF